MKNRWNKEKLLADRIDRDGDSLEDYYVLHWDNPEEIDVLKDLAGEAVEACRDACLWDLLDEWRDFLYLMEDTLEELHSL